MEAKTERKVKVRKKKDARRRRNRRNKSKSARFESVRFFFFLIFSKFRRRSYVRTEEKRLEEE